MDHGEDGGQQDNQTIAAPLRVADKRAGGQVPGVEVSGPVALEPAPQPTRDAAGRWLPGFDPRGRAASEAASVTGYLRQFAAMTPGELASRCELYAAELRRADPGGRGGMSMAALVAVRLLMGAINDPDGPSAGRVLERLDGRVPLAGTDDGGGVVVVVSNNHWRPDM